MSCHVIVEFAEAARIVTWHVVSAAISSCVETAIELPAHLIVTRTAALASTCQVPGPRKGTSASTKCALSWPLTAPLEAEAPESFVLDAPLDLIATEEVSAPLTVADGAVLRCSVVVVVGAGAWVEWRGVAVVRPEAREVARTGSVVEVEVVVGEIVVRVSWRVARWRGGVELDEAVSVKTRTKSSTGLDQTTQCVLLSECVSLMMVLAG
ncbi:MAG TPA: hypothetical protein VGG21_03180 [Acidimicrobiales bacterium]